MAKTVRVIPATPRVFRSEATEESRRRRTAGYARVSTDHEEQASSYEMQMAHYKNYIESRADWNFVGMYSDEGISGTNTKKRDGFNQMIEDALAGKRPHHYKVGQPLCEKHRRFTSERPKTQGKRGRDLF